MENDFVVITDIGPEDSFYPIRDQLIGRAVIPTRGRGILVDFELPRHRAGDRDPWWWGECTLVKGDPVVEPGTDGKPSMIVDFYQVKVRPRERWDA